MSAFDQNLLDLQPIEWKNWLPFISKLDKDKADSENRLWSEEEIADEFNYKEGPKTAKEWEDWELSGNEDPTDKLYPEQLDDLKKEKEEKEAAEKR